MRIISSFQDYYDGVQSQGRDEQVLFRREASLHEVDVPLMPWAAPRLARGHLSNAPSGPLTVTATFRARPHSGLWMQDANQVTFKRAYVLVGGRAHPVWLQGNYLSRAAADALVMRSEDFDPAQWKLGEPAALGDPDLLHAVEAWATSRGQENPELTFKQLNIRMGEGPQAKTLPWEQFKDDPMSHVPAAWREHERFHAAAQVQDWTALHLDHDAPVLLLINRHEARWWWDKASSASSWLVRNPRLKDLRMGSTLDSYTLFQEISMFIGGVMPGQQSPMVQVSDRTQVVKKGFDPIYGFRRRPQNAGS